MMKPFRVVIAVGALAASITWAEPAAAAWNNVFQVTCYNRPRTSGYAPIVAGSAPVVAYSVPPVVQPVPIAAAAPCPCPCPQTNCTTNYVQRCYYQPVTTYQSQSYYEQVTTYRTSYYAEPVTSYRYSCYYDPCTCSYQQVAVPQTSYVMRAQSCPVQSWVQRCASVPVTTLQKSCYWEPRTTCCSTTVGAPIVAPCNGTFPAQAVPAIAAPPLPAGPPPVVTTQPPVVAQPQPQVQEQRSFSPIPGNPPTIQEHRAPTQGGPNVERYYGNQPETGEPPAYRQPTLQGPTQPAHPSSNLPTRPAVKLDRIAQAGDTQVQGLVLTGNNAPKANARMVFVNAGQGNAQRQVTANTGGRFQVALATGSWLVYVQGADGRQSYHSRIDVNDRTAPYLTLVSR